MRCVSKCFIGGRSFRLYYLIGLGVLAGFTLSTIIHTLDVASLQKSTSLNLYPHPLDRARERERGEEVGFSNLAKKSVVEELPQAQDIQFGDYYYAERDALEGRNRGEEAKEQVRAAHVLKAPSSVPIVAGPEAIKLKKMEYQSEGWHGRNVKETSNGLPPNKISDELFMRQTLLIAVITSVTQLMTQTLSIQGTWGPEAAQIIFFIGEVETLPHLPHGMEVIRLEGVDDASGGWELKEISVVKYLMEHYVTKTDWFMVVGDQTYVATESLEKKLNSLDASMSVYIGRPGEVPEGGNGLLCMRNPGVIYSRALLEGLRPYLPMCWPAGHQEEEEVAESHTLGGCIGVMGIKCTQAKEDLAKAVAVHPVQYPKYMYRLHSFYKELQYNASLNMAKKAASVVSLTLPFIPSHLRSPYKIGAHTTTTSSSATLTPSATTPNSRSEGAGVVVRPRHVPKNKFEINYWDYFNQTRLMSIMNESPARGIIGGMREEARYALTKAIYLANQGVPQSQRYVFEKLENGYHRVDPMRGSEFILDFIFRRQSNKHTKIKKRLSILRPFHETVIPLDTPEMLPTVNFLVTLSGLSDRLEHFLMQYETNVLQLGEDATLTIVLFESPDAPKVRLMIQQYLTRYQGAHIVVRDIQGEFTRGVGLDYGLSKFSDDQLVFIVDVDLNIATGFLQRCRLNVIQSKQVYFPVFFKLYNKEFVDKYRRGNQSLEIARHRGHWAHYSYGMACMYASDYRKSGGFDVSMRGWGEEDVDLMNKVLKSGLEVFRAPDPGLVHNWHSKMCNKAKVTNTAAYEHCLQSKGENLADRIELAQYVFENELRTGKVL